MKRFVPIFATVLTIGFAACAPPEGSAPATTESTDRSHDALQLGREALGRDAGVVRKSEPPKCGAPHATPTWTPPADDSIAFGSLLEGAGYGAESNSDWTDIASGNFCGGAEKELVLLKNRHSNFSIMRGPTPYAVGAFDNESDDAHPWRTVAAGDLDGDSFDEIVALRKVTAAGVPDVFVMKVDPSACDVAKVTQSATVGGVGDSEWLDAAVGNFDGTGKKVALLKAWATSFYLLGQKGSSLAVEWSSDLDTNAAYPWKGIAAGDLDGDGIDELVATRRVSDGKGTTVVVYKWTKGSFRRVATGTFGNTGNSEWAGVSVGDFNGDHHGAIALVKNKHSNFVLLDLPAGSLKLRELATSDLDSVDGQDWRGVTAVDWLGGDNGAAELVPVRAAKGRYRADLFVYGNPFHRVARDSGIASQRAEWDHNRDIDAATTLKGVKDVHANTVSFTMVVPGDYDRLVAFLQATQGNEGCVDGQQVRVSATVAPKGSDFDPAACLAPADSGLTTWIEEDYLTVGAGAPHGDKCLDFVGWARILGRLAHDYPNLVSMGVDDMTHYTDYFTGERVAEMQARMRQLAPW
ncbi:MAG TPA: VCBS repeat-containing protein, partial [Labilithrix sp.]|nr:VCBS repeat-containing protein [Labilithrix sp.]